MTIKRMIHVAVATGLLGAFGTANAVSITAVADTTDVTGLGQVSVQFFGDFSDDPTVGGSFDILFNSADLAVADYSQAAVGDPGFLVPGAVTDGNIVGTGFGDFNGVGGAGFLIATVVFDIINQTFASTDISMATGTGGGGGFFSAVTFAEQVVDYNGVTLNQAPIPLPAAVWLMMGGLIPLLVVSRTPPTWRGFVFRGVLRCGFPDARASVLFRVSHH